MVYSLTLLICRRESVRMTFLTITIIRIRLGFFNHNLDTSDIHCKITQLQKVITYQTLIKLFGYITMT